MAGPQHACFSGIRAGFVRACSQSVRGREKRGLERSRFLQIFAGLHQLPVVYALQPNPICTFALHGQNANKL